MNWTQQEAIDLCVKIEAVAPKFGCHVALTGGCLYKAGVNGQQPLRKDADILFYRIRQKSIDMEGLFKALNELGIMAHPDNCWRIKGIYYGKPIDLLFPDFEGEYKP